MLSLEKFSIFSITSIEICFPSANFMWCVFRCCWYLNELTKSNELHIYSKFEQDGITSNQMTAADWNENFANGSILFTFSYSISNHNNICLAVDELIVAEGELSFHFAFLICQYNAVWFVSVILFGHQSYIGALENAV